MVYKVDILMNYDSHLRMVKDEGALIGISNRIDNSSFSYIFDLDMISDYKGFITDQKLKKDLAKRFIETYGEHMSWESFRILSIRRA